MVTCCLAHVDTSGISTHQIKNLLGHQTVIEHNIRLLHQTQSLKSQQIRIAGAAAYQIDLTCFKFRGALELVGQQLFGLIQIVCVGLLGDGAVKDLLPECLAISAIGKFGLYLLAKTSRKGAQFSHARREQAFESCAQQPH